MSWAEDRRHSKSASGGLELGVVHPRDRCAYCGVELGEFDIVVIEGTGARALVCTDGDACQARQAQLPLFEGTGS